MAEGASGSGSGPKKSITTFELLDDGRSFAVEGTDDEGDDPACRGLLKHPVPEPEQFPAQQQQEEEEEEEVRPRLWRRAHLFWQRSRHGQQQEQPGQQEHRAEHRGQQQEQPGQEQGQHPAQQQQVPQEQHDRQPPVEEHRQQAGSERLWERPPRRMEERQLAGGQRMRRPWWPELPDPEPEGGDGTLVKNIRVGGRFTVTSMERVAPEDPNAGRELNPEPEPATWLGRRGQRGRMGGRWQDGGKGPRGHVGPSSSRTTAVEIREEEEKEEIGEGRGGNEGQSHDQCSLLFDGSHPELFSWFMRLNFEVLP